MGILNRDWNLDDAVYISLFANIFGKGMNPTILPLAIDY